MKQSAESGSLDHKVLFIAGHSRIGSTILERILNEGQRFCAIGELKYIWTAGILANHLCGCGSPFRECAFWCDVLEEAFGTPSKVPWQDIARLSTSVGRSRNLPLLLGKACPSSLKARVREYSGVLRRLYSAIFTVSSKQVIVDSSKYAQHAIFLNTIPWINLYVLHMVRDSRAVAYSWKRYRPKPEIPGQTSYMNRQSSVRTSVEWLYFNTAAEHLAKSSFSYKLLRYEDFSKAPGREICRMMEWLEEAPPSPRYEGSRFRLAAVNHGIAGNPVRFSNANITIKTDTEWVAAMSAWDRLTVTALTWPLLARYYRGSCQYY